MIIESEHLKVIKETLEEHATKGDEMAQISDTFMMLDIIMIVEFLTVRMTGLCVCRSLPEGSKCKPCHTLEFVYGPPKPEGKPKLVLV